MMKLSVFSIPSTDSEEGIEITEEDRVDIVSEEEIDECSSSQDIEKSPLADSADPSSWQLDPTLPMNQSAEVTSTSTIAEQQHNSIEATHNEHQEQLLPPMTWTLDPPPLCLDTWVEQPGEEFQVRGPTYLEDGIKQFSESSVLKLFAVDLVHVPKPLWTTGLSQHPHERIQQALRSEQTTGKPQLPDFVLAVNLVLPGATSSDQFYHWVTYFGTNQRLVLTDATTPFGRLASPFFFGSHDLDAFRARIFKLIPRVADGNFLVRSVVGGKPTLLGQKMKEYFIFDPCTGRGDGTDNKPPRRYLEILIDISSNPVANRIVKLVLGYATCLSIDIMFLLEAGNNKKKTTATSSGCCDEQSNNLEQQELNSTDTETNTTTLPERILGGIRIKNIDFAKAQRPCVSTLDTVVGIGDVDASAF